MTENQPIRIEQSTDDDGEEYVTEWYTDPPPAGTPFRITLDEWTESEDKDIRVHRIYTIATD